jgi:hypothetical protein
MTCSGLWAIHQRKCKNGKKEVSLDAYLGMKSLLVGIGFNFVKCATIMIAVLAVTSGPGSSFD